MSQLLIGKVAAITGGTSGIGRAIALDFLRHGADVAVNHLDDEWSHNNFAGMEAEKPKDAPGRLISVPGDISDPEHAKIVVDKTVEAFGKLDVFVSNAGVCEFADFLQ
jgi:L-rhamnose 1-dehydrogenase